MEFIVSIIECCLNPSSWFPLAAGASFTQPLREIYALQSTCLLGHQGHGNISWVTIAMVVSNVLYVYRVTLVVEYLGWVDLDLGYSPILLGQ